MVDLRTRLDRRTARIIVFQILCEVQSAQHDHLLVLERRIKEDGLPSEIAKFAQVLTDKVLVNRYGIDKIITTYAPDWPIEQMSVIDLNLLRLAIGEIIWGDDTPQKVAINEAVELAKAFGSDKSPGFVNGVLGGFMTHEAASSDGSSVST